MVDNKVEYISTAELAERLNIDSSSLIVTLMKNKWIKKKSDKFILIPTCNQNGGEYRSNKKLNDW